MVVGVVVGVVVALPRLVFSRQRLLTHEVSPRDAKSSDVKKRLHAPPPGRVLYQHVVAELAEQMGLFFCFSRWCRQNDSTGERRPWLLSEPSEPP